MSVHCEQAGETLLCIGNACGLYRCIQTWLYLDTAGASSRGPFQCFYPVLGMCLQLALAPVVPCGVLSHLSLLLQGCPTRPPQQLLTVRQASECPSR